MSKYQARARELSTRTGFSVKEVEELIERYRQLDRSKNVVDGISLDSMLTVPEFIGHPFIADILRVSATGKAEANNVAAPSKSKNQPATITTKKTQDEEVDESALRIMLEDYVLLAWKLSSKSSDIVKQELAWRVIDIWQAGTLRQAEMFRVYRMLMAHSLTDDQCLDFAYRALNLPQLKKVGEITKEEFFDLVPPYEIRIKFTIDLQTKSSQ